MKDYIPLGSVVYLHGGVQKVLLIARAINVRKGNKVFFFDYGGVPYPEGLVSDRAAYFNKEDIAKVVFMGYQDEDDDMAVENIRRYLAEHPETVRGNVKVFSEA